MSDSQKIKVNIDVSFFNKKYVPYLNCEARYQIFYGGSGSGKSNFVSRCLILKLMKEKLKLLVIRQTFSSIRDSVFAEFMTALDEMQLLQYVKVSKTTLNITFPNGSTILFKGGDSEEKLLSISGIDICWIEEASEISKDLWQQLSLRLRGGKEKKQFYLTFNPIHASHWLKEQFFDNPMDDTVICHSTYKDNPHLDDEYIQNLLDLKERNPQKYEVFALGKWGTTGKRIFENWQIKNFNPNKLVQENENLEAVFGMDFGYISDPSTLICSLVDLNNRQLYIFDEMFEKGLLNNQIAQMIKQKGYSKELIVADSAERKSIDEIKSYGIHRIKPAKKGAGSIMTGIQFIQQFQIFVHPNCTNTIDELENYSYKKDKMSGTYLNEPIDKFNHLLDALRYSLEQYMRRNKPNFLDKSIFGI